MLELLEEFTQADPGYSAQVCVIHRDEVVLDISVGPDLLENSLIGVFSSSKGIAGVVIASLIESGALVLDKPVTAYWPEFGAAEKDDMSVRSLLSHRAGVLGLEGGFTLEELTNHTLLAARLAGSRPVWRTGAGHGYHAVTIGVFIEELVRRITGTTFSDLYRSTVKEPLGVDFHFGVDAEAQARVVSILPPLPAGNDGRSPLAAIPAGGILSLAFSIESLPPLYEQADHPLVQAFGPAAFGGVGNARSMATIYAACLPKSRHRLARPDTFAAMAQIHSNGPDLVLDVSTRFGLVFQVPDGRLPFGSPWAFGHDGAGGSLAFADPKTDLAFGYTTRRMPAPPGCDPRALRLAHAAQMWARSRDH
jgi:CubicO group peptidase (beta-lactamase class C family)